MGKKPFYIIDQDKYLAVVDKPPGMLAVPIKNSDVENLEDLVAYEMGKHGVTIGTVHRIDRFTSGIMVFAKRRKAYEELVRQFRNQEPERVYLAVVRGRLEQKKGELTHYLKLVKEGFRNIVVDQNEPDATYAHLYYEVLEGFKETTLVEVRLDTGLKNQIRVQFAEEGYPIVGDQHYAPAEKNEKRINRQALHAYKLTIEHPHKNRPETYQAKIPPDLRALLKYYRQQ